MATGSVDNLSIIAYEAAKENFEALAETIGCRGAEGLQFEPTSPDELDHMTQDCETGVFLVLLGGTDVDISRGANELKVQEPRSEEELYEYTHSFVLIKTEEEGLQCFQQYPGGMDSEKECFAVEPEFFDLLGRLTAHSRAGCVPKTFQMLFCGSSEPSVVPPHDTMIVKGLSF